MPPNPERRNQILDAAIDILCDDGVGGLTHRQVDSRAGVPAGTTSNYFRTRQALLEATAQRTVDLHWQRRQCQRPRARQPDQRVKAPIARGQRHQPGQPLGMCFITHARIIAPG